jgi:erythromycin esterase-like protein
MSDASTVRDVIQPLLGNAHDYDSLVDLTGDARFVLIGEASHGTHEFYFERAEIAKRLIERTSVWDAGELPETYPFAV